MDYNTIAQNVDKNTLLGMRIISLSFVGGVVMFLAITVLFYFMEKPETLNEVALTSIASTLTIVTFAYLIVAIPLSVLLFKKTLKTHKRDNPTVLIGNIRSAMLVRLAILEGGALLALVTILLAVMDGYIYASPIVWINLVPVAYFALHVFANFPTVDRIAGIYSSYFEA
jgi:hypothetical protein